MEDASGPSLSDAADFDLMDELLSGDCWLETLNCSYLPQPSTSTSGPLGSSSFLPNLEISSNPILSEVDNRQVKENSAFSRTPTSQHEVPVEDNLDGYLRSELASTNLWAQQVPIVPIRERLVHALRFIKESQREGGVLLQIWVPIWRGDRHFLSTCGQPFWLDPDSQSLANYRLVSTSYEFSAKENSNEAVGLPGRVFIGRVPEWTPDVRYFTSYEFPRLGHAQQYNVSGTMALPIFEPNSRSCLGVVEVVLTNRKISYSSDLENICNALQAVDLRSSDLLTSPRVKVNIGGHQAALPEILNVLKAVCETHNLPLAQTWISCIQQGKGGSRHSDKNYMDCVSTVDAACYVNDPYMVGFQEACSEHHLFRGQGVAGKAFTTNQPCFSPDITSFLKTEYPLSHHAKLFSLRAAVAIRLRSICTGNADFVLEFFLPVSCIGSEEQKLMLHSLSNTIQQACDSLRVLTTKELEDEAVLRVDETFPSDILFDDYISGSDQRPDVGNIVPVGSPAIAVSGEAPSWIASLMEAQENGASSVLPLDTPLEFSKEVVDFKITNNCDLSDGGNVSSKLKHGHQDSMEDADSQKNSFSSDPSFPTSGKATEKRRTRAEKTVSLEVLRQYFAGSLKDAAKSIGVCPTTLKRICRQHGITRWPSRKIKKVGHSLHKIQMVIDSVHGAKGTFQFSSLYQNLRESSVPDKVISGSNALCTQKQIDHPESSSTHQLQELIFNANTSASNSLSSSSCSHSSSSSLGCSSGSKQGTSSSQIVIKQEASMDEKQMDKLERAHSEVDLQFSNQEPPRSFVRSQSHKDLREHPPSLHPSYIHKNRRDLLKVKAICGEEKVRFRLESKWGFQELKQEAMKRFNISDVSSVYLKYLDDDSEWVLLTCDADLEECIDVHKSIASDTLKISVHHAAQLVTSARVDFHGLS